MFTVCPRWFTSPELAKRRESSSPSNPRLFECHRAYARRQSVRRHSQGKPQRIIQSKPHILMPLAGRQKSVIDVLWHMSNVQLPVSNTMYSNSEISDTRGSLGDAVVAVQPSISGIHLCERVSIAIKQLKRVPGRDKHGTDCATFTHQNLNGLFRGLLL